jgi:uncharacterized protein YcnI
VAVLVLSVAGPAAAHVTVQPGEATAGGFATVAFQVPNERDDAETTQLEVTFPEEYPIRSVRVRPLAGWTANVQRAPLDEPIEAEGEEITETVSTITWSGGRIGVDEFERFEVSMGPLPEDAEQLVFRALQTYDSGEVVRWIELTEEGGEEPEHPAPTLQLVAADGESGDGHGTSSDDPASGGTTTTADGGTEPATGEQAAASDGSDDEDDGQGLAIAAIVVGGLGLVVGGVALARTRRTT